MNQETKNFLSDMVQRNHGLRIPLLDEQRVNSGWVVNGKLDSSITSLFQTEVVPLMPNPQTEEGARCQQELEEMRQRRGEGFAAFVWKGEGWMFTFVRPEKLKAEDPKRLLREVQEARKLCDDSLAAALEAEYQIATGCLDLR